MHPPLTSCARSHPWQFSTFTSITSHQPSVHLPPHVPVGIQLCLARSVREITRLAFHDHFQSRTFTSFAATTPSRITCRLPSKACTRAPLQRMRNMSVTHAVPLQPQPPYPLHWHSLLRHAAHGSPLPLHRQLRWTQQPSVSSSPVLLIALHRTH